ncbi:MAG: HD domain-containing phosphohydrolase [Kangiellaceae bacterium]|jgi:putative nucleotidyltransferase with HDIG domain|nr:HD domain-containing phosphohydrolase [Kangiellaceae bacterium]
MSHIKKVKVMSGDLEIGMFVSELDRDWSETSFLLQGFEIQDNDDLSNVNNQCEYVYVDFDNEADFRLYESKQKNKQLEPEEEFSQQVVDVPIEDEIETARKAFKYAAASVKAMIYRVMLGEQFEFDTIRLSVKACMDSILRNESAMLMMTLIKNRDHYTAEHCLNVGILGMSFARYLEMPESEIEMIGLCGMLHDLGKVKIPRKILNKQDKLSEREFERVKKHPEQGYKMLIEKGDIPSQVLDVAYNHHERLDGTGYPRKLQGEEISLTTRIISIIDVFDAITSDRCYDNSHQ